MKDKRPLLLRKSPSELIVLELGRALQFLNVAVRAEEVREQFCKAVGLVDSRNVHEVMPIEARESPLEATTSLKNATIEHLDYQLSRLERKARKTSFCCGLSSPRDLIISRFPSLIKVLKLFSLPIVV